MSLFGGIEIPGRPCLENVRRLDLLPIPMVRKMHRLGIAVDVPYLQEFSVELGHQLVELERDIANFIPPESLHYFSDKSAEIDDADDFSDFNANSSEQKRTLLYDLLKIGRDRDIKKTASGKLSTGKKILEGMREEHPVIAKMLAYSERAKLKSAFADSLPRKAKFHPRNSDGSCPVCELPHVDSTWRIHPEFPMTRTETGRFASRNPNCFDGKTEILTDQGWIRFDRYKQQHGHVQVAQWDDGKISFVKADAFIEQDVSEILHFTNQHIDLCVTPEHRCLLQNRKTQEMFVTTAENYSDDYRQICAGQWDGGSGIDLTNSEIRLLVALQADGSFSEKGRIDISFSKVRKIERFTSLLRECKIHFTETSDDRRTRFYLNVPKLFTLLGQTKSFGPWLLEFSHEQVEVFLSEIMFWDGCWTRKNHYSTTVKGNADWVQILFALSGKRAKVREYCQTYNDKGIWAWNVDVTDRNFSLTTNIKRSRKLAPTRVFCVSVSSSFIVVRRNGSVMVTGNCQQIPARSELGGRIRNAFIASPGTRFVSSDFSQIELRDLAHAANAKSMIDVYNDDKDIHLYTACRTFGKDYSKYSALSVKKERGQLTPEEKIDWSDFSLNCRLPSKNVNFLIVYGATAIGLQAQLALSGLYWSEEQCDEFILNWFTLYPEVRAYMELNHYRARRYGYVWDAFGRIRRVPETQSIHSYIRSAGLRQCGNMPIQATSAGQTKLVMGELDEHFSNIYSDGQGSWVWPLLTIHDQLMVEADEEIASDIAELMKHCFSHVMNDRMTGESLWRVPIKSDGEILERWKKE